MKIIGKGIDVHAAHVVGTGLVPGGKVARLAKLEQKSSYSFLRTALGMDLNLPADYSVTYKNHLKDR